MLSYVLEKGDVMFSQEKMIGLSLQRLDEKNRFIMPGFTFASKGDQLILFQEDNYFSIYHETYFDNVISQFDQNSLSHLKDFLILKKQYDSFMSNVFAKVTVDGQKRILIPKLVKSIYQLDGNVVVNGALDHVNVYSENHYKKILQK